MNRPTSNPSLIYSKLQTTSLREVKDKAPPKKRQQKGRRMLMLMVNLRHSSEEKVVIRGKYN